jgi:nicotinamidase-related amidase
MCRTLLILDFINEIVHKDGKLAGKGYSDYILRNNVFDNLNQMISKARGEDIPIIFVKLGFSRDYREQLKNSPLFGRAHEFKALQLDTWGTEIHEKINIEPEDQVLIKHRVSAFYNTDLEDILKKNNVDIILIAGVATDLVVSSTARDAHDRGYNVTIVEDCCGAANTEDHKNEIRTLSKIAKIQKQKEIA